MFSNLNKKRVNKRYVPKLRFKGFEGGYKEIKISDVSKFYKGDGYSKYTLESFMGMNLSHELVIFLEFITRTPTIGGFVSKLKSLVIGNPLMTEDGRLMICYNGFKDAVINHEEEIKRFLYS